MIAKTSEIDSADSVTRKRKERGQIFDRHYLFILDLYRNNLLYICGRYSDTAVQPCGIQTLSVFPENRYIPLDVDIGRSFQQTKLIKNTFLFRKIPILKQQGNSDNTFPAEVFSRQCNTQEWILTLHNPHQKTLRLYSAQDFPAAFYSIFQLPNLRCP